MGPRSTAGAAMANCALASCASSSQAHVNQHTAVGRRRRSDRSRAAARRTCRPPDRARAPSCRRPRIRPRRMLDHRAVVALVELAAPLRLDARGAVEDARARQLIGRRSSKARVEWRSRRSLATPTFPSPGISAFTRVCDALCGGGEGGAMWRRERVRSIFAPGQLGRTAGGDRLTILSTQS